MNVRQGKPFFHPPNRTFDGHGAFKNFGMGGNADKSQNHNPSEGHAFISLQTLLPPLKSLLMMAGTWVVRVKQQVRAF